jgi:hypothetical protein
MDDKYTQLIRNGYSFEFGKYFSEGWNLYKKGLGSYLGFTFVGGIIISAAFFILYVLFVLVLMGSVINTDSDFDPDQLGSLLLGIVIFYLVFIFLANVIQNCLLGGYYSYSVNLVRKKEDFSQFFNGFKYFRRIAVFVLIYALITIPLLVAYYAIFIPFGMIEDMLSGGYMSPYEMESYTQEMMGLWPLSYLLYFVFIAIYLIYSMAVPLIVDGGLKPWAAMETSRKVVSKQFFPFLALIIILGIIFFVATIFTCGLGFFFALPFTICVHFAAYDQIFNPEREATVEDIDYFGLEEKDSNTESEEGNI